MVRQVDLPARLHVDHVVGRDDHAGVLGEPSREFPKMLLRYDRLDLAVRHPERAALLEGVPAAVPEPEAEGVLVAPLVPIIVGVLVLRGELAFHFCL